MMVLGKITTLATAVVCLAVLAISIYPGWLNDLFSLAVLLGFLAAPVVLAALAIFVFIQYRRGNLRLDEFPLKYAMILLLMLCTTYVALRFYLPRRIAFATCRSSFQQIVDDGIADDREFSRRIGPYQIDKCLIDDRGGTYFRVYSGVDGIGPDVMSYGFCYNPNRDGSPFGAAQYRTFRLGKGWYWFRASDDWF